MEKLFIAIISILIASAVSSCSIVKSKIETAKAERVNEIEAKRERPAIKRPSVGDTVIARWGPALWAEGKVSSIKEEINEAMIAWEDGSSPSSVDIADVFQKPTTVNDVFFRPGEFTLAKSGTDHWWNGVLIKEVNGTVIKAKIINGGEIVNLPLERVLIVSDAVAADIKDSAERQNFLDTAHEYRPVAPAGYVPKVGDHILGEWTTNAWYGGKVKAIADGRLLIVWENGMSPDHTQFEKIVPFPTTSNAGNEPPVGTYVLLKPTGGNPKAAWVYGQVTSAGSNGIEAKSLDFGTREYASGEFVVLEK